MCGGGGGGVIVCLREEESGRWRDKETEEGRESDR